ncbi:MAG TPA: glycoside hydrolase family 36 protein, partial [Chloroflexota bacterium]|nr:glycoside hydrolase family 36 protein [Chloroflexota bacterium]
MWAGALTLGRLPGAPLTSNQPASTGGAGLAEQAAQFIDRFDHTPPFSFLYGGRPSAQLLAHWPRTHQRATLDANRTQHTIGWSDPQGGLAVRCEVVEYHDFPTIDWTLFFKHTGARHAPSLSEVLALDTALQGRSGAACTVHTCNGSAAVAEDYGLQQIPLAPRASMLFTCMGGRPTNGYFGQDVGLSRSGSPYYNIDWGGEGAIVVVGWPGQWAAEITRDAGAGLRLQAGMCARDGAVLASGDHIGDTALLDLTLQPGEEIRTPRIVVQFWQGADWIAAQNIWRRWMLAHNMPRPNGKLPAPMCPTQSSFYGTNMLGCSAATDLQVIDADAADHIARATGGVVDHWWMDAGWYQEPPIASDWTWTGTWTPDPKRYPHGLRPVTDHARARGMKTIVWHEPERVREDTWLYTQHPEWLLGPLPTGDDTHLLNLGNPKAWSWAVEHFDGLIRQQGIDVFRQDFNMDPLAYWNISDSPGRRGITQIRHVTGFLAFWDELRRRHPNLLIDCCASGGRRNDLETVRRAVPLWRSDDNGNALDEQCHTYGIAFWLPYSGSGISPSDVYTLRSGMMPGYQVFMQVVSGTSATTDLAMRMLREWRAFAATLLGDYYPLTPYSIDTNIWMAWQFDRPEAGTGVVQAFRRDTSTDGS